MKFPWRETLSHDDDDVDVSRGTAIANNNAEIRSEDIPYRMLLHLEMRKQTKLLNYSALISVKCVNLYKHV